MDTDQSNLYPVMATLEATTDSTPRIVELLEAILAELKAMNKRQDRIWMID